MRAPTLASSLATALGLVFAPALSAPALSAAALSEAALPAQGTTTAPERRIELRAATDRSLGPAEEGRLVVFEDRARGAGREIALRVLVLRATAKEPRPDPVFFLAGGPGQAATVHARGLARSWMRRERDIVLVDQRGTGGSNPLQIELPGSDEDLQGYLDPMFDVAVFERAREKLERVADLTQYTTPIAMDDLDDVRRALGYGKINLVGGSYGTRAALIFMRRHSDAVRTAILTGVAPLAFKNPLYHAQAAQIGFDVLCAECDENPRYRKAFGDLGAKLEAVLARLEREPAVVKVHHPGAGDERTVRLSRAAFAEALRVMLYYMPYNRDVPQLLHRAYEGDYRAFAENAIRSNRGLRTQLHFGMLMSVVGSEDIPRIDPSEIGPATAGTFLGDGRVRRQIACSEVWPRGAVGEDYGAPVAVDVPVLLLSGTHDPVTPPRWGAEAARHLPNSLHVVVPAAHGISLPSVERLRRAFLDAASVVDLDTSFVADLRPPRLRLPQ